MTTRTNNRLTALRRSDAGTGTGRRAPMTAAALVALASLLGACANNTPTSAGADGTTAPTVAAAPAGSGATESASAGALLSTSAAGDIMVGPDGRALYGFTNDVDAESTCYGTCAEAWPPVIVGADWTVGPGLDTGIFATTVREDGQLQLVAGKWPLYYYAGDAVAGDIKGQGSGDVWFLVAPDGRLITDVEGTGDGDDEEATGAGSEYGTGGATGTTGADDGKGALSLSKASTPLGEVLADAEGLTLYGFTSDVDKTPSCYDACADAWPPLLVESSELPEGLDPDVYSVVEREDGTWQLAAGDWPLYLFGGDEAAGDVNGQGSGGKWFAVAPDGKLIKS